MSSATVDVPGYRSGKWRIAENRSHIRFAVRHSGPFIARGSLGSFDGEIVTAEDPLRSTVNSTIRVASLDFGSKGRDKATWSSDFLDVENHPEITFRSTGVRVEGKGLILDGELTALGDPYLVALPLNVDGFVDEDDGTPLAKFSVRTQLVRREVGLVYRGRLPVLDRILLGPKLSLDLKIEAVLVS